MTKLRKFTIFGLVKRIFIMEKKNISISYEEYKSIEELSAEDAELATDGARGSRGTSRTRSEPGPCPNLPQRPGSSRGAQEESLIFRGFLRDLSRPGAPLWQIWTRPDRDRKSVV